MNQLQKAILKTLAYADIFDYPLNLKEIQKFLIGKKFKSQEKIKKEIQESPELLLRIDHQKNFYFLKGREKIVKLRREREKISQKKLKIAQRVSRWLKIIPTIKMVAVTGALAMNNSDEEGDIDLLIITKKNRLWLTRFLVVFLVELIAKRRRPQDKKVKDKICLNMFLDEDHLKIPKKEQNLFTAHEVCQVKTLWQKDKTYQKFFKVNLWLKNFLPNWKI